MKLFIPVISAYLYNAVLIIPYSRQKIPQDSAFPRKSVCTARCLLVYCSHIRWLHSQCHLYIYTTHQCSKVAKTYSIVKDYGEDVVLGVDTVSICNTSFRRSFSLLQCSATFRVFYTYLFLSRIAVESMSVFVLKKS